MAKFAKIIMTCLQIYILNTFFRALHSNFRKSKSSIPLEVLEGTFLISVHMFLILRKWRGGFPPSLLNCTHDKWHKNVMLLGTNTIQRIIKYYYINMVINNDIISFYSSDNHRYYFSVLLHLLRYLNKTH